MGDVKNWIRRHDVALQYKIIDKVGRGTYGTVYKAKNLKSNKYLALKKLENNDQKLQAQGFPITALRQINLLKKMSHKNIIRLQQIILSKPSKRNLFRGSTFLVFDYMEHDLAGLFKNKVKFKMPEIKCIMKQLLQGVAYLHANKIMHRDIKSANILMNDNGDVRLGDFGLGRQIKLQSVFTFKVVTLWYRAPELLLGCKTYTPKIDVWSIGCVFAQFLIGQILFKRQADYAQLERIYEIMGGYQENGVSNTILSTFTHYGELKPKKSYQPNLRQHILKLNPGVDQITMDFLQGLLCMNPQKRFSCQQALQHQFFTTKPLPCKPKELTKLDVEYHQMAGSQMKIVREEQQRKRPKRVDGSQDSYGRHRTPSPENKIGINQRFDRRPYYRDFRQQRYSNPVRQETLFPRRDQRKSYGQRNQHVYDKAFRQQKGFKEQYHTYERKKQYEKKPDYPNFYREFQRKVQSKMQKYDRSQSKQRKKEHKDRHKQRKDRRKSHSNSKYSDRSSSRSSHKKSFRRSRDKSNIRQEKHRDKGDRNFDHYRDRKEQRRQAVRNSKQDDRYTHNRDRKNYRQREYSQKYDRENDYSKDKKNYRQDDRRHDRGSQKAYEPKYENRRQTKVKDQGYKQIRKDEAYPRQSRNFYEDRNDRYDRNDRNDRNYREPFDRYRRDQRQPRDEGKIYREYRDQRPRNYDMSYRSKPRQEGKGKKGSGKGDSDIEY